MYQANVFFKLQNFNGDVSGNLNGNFGIYANATDANSTTQGGAPMGPGGGTGMIGNVNVNAKLVTGEDPITTLEAALAAKFN